MSHETTPAQTVTKPVTDSPAATERYASKYINFSPAALRKWRREGRGPAYVRVGRSIRYRIADLDLWLSRHRIVTRESDLLVVVLALALVLDVGVGVGVRVC